MLRQRPFQSNVIRVSSGTLVTIFAGGCGFGMKIVVVKYRGYQWGEKEQQGDEEDRFLFHRRHLTASYRSLEIIKAVVIVSEGS